MNHLLTALVYNSPTKNTDQSSDLSTGQSGIQGLGTLYPNTSLAATTLPNKDRRVYFQDASGHIREAQYSYSTGTWDTAIGFVVSEAAINGTSIAADSANVTTREMESYVSKSLSETQGFDRLLTNSHSRHKLVWLLPYNWTRRTTQCLELLFAEVTS